MLASCVAIYIYIYIYLSLSLSRYHEYTPFSIAQEAKLEAKQMKAKATGLGLVRGLGYVGFSCGVRV